MILYIPGGARFLPSTVPLDPCDHGHGSHNQRTFKKPLEMMKFGPTPMDIFFTTRAEPPIEGLMGQNDV